MKVTLKEHFDMRLWELEKRCLQMFASNKDAVDKAETALKDYKGTANEFRGTLEDQAKTFVPRSEYESTVKELRSTIDAQAKLIVSLQLGESRGEGGSRADVNSRAQSWQVTGLVLTIAIFILGALITYFTTRHQ